MFSITLVRSHFTETYGIIPKSHTHTLNCIKVCQQQQNEMQTFWIKLSYELADTILGLSNWIQTQNRSKLIFSWSFYVLLFGWSRESFFLLLEIGYFSYSAIRRMDIYSLSFSIVWLNILRWYYSFLTLNVDMATEYVTNISKYSRFCMFDQFA